MQQVDRVLAVRGQEVKVNVAENKKGTGTYDTYIYIYIYQY